MGLIAAAHANWLVAQQDEKASHCFIKQNQGNLQNGEGKLEDRFPFC